MHKKSDNINNPKPFSEISNAEKTHDMLIPEEFPEGTYGSPMNKHDKVESKSTEWEKGQQRTSAFSFADKEIHNEIPRKGPGTPTLHEE